MAGRLKGARRAAALGLLALVVTALHLVVASRALESRLGEGAADRTPRRIEVAFVRELAPAEPPTPPVRRRPAPARRAAPAAAPAASTPEAEPAGPEPAELAASAAAAAEFEQPASAPAAADPPPPVQAALPPDAAASEPQAFEWPPSTRLAYTLSGNFRGPVEGQAQVEWLRSGSHYQVRLELSIGPSFAPVVTRRVSSDGELTERGLQPQRYDEVTKVAFSDPRRLTILFDGEHIHLPTGQDLPQPADVQDTASQFVQLTWLFTTQPHLLASGTSIALPLALPRYVDTWIYDVLERETLATPVGPVEAVHVKPRREPRPGIDLTAEMWVAPALQYLPVRILIHQDAQSYIDLLITQLPLQAMPGH
jgi:hypothetical protein